MSSDSIIGPIFLDDSVTGEKYLELLNEHVYPEIRRRRQLGRYRYQQDGVRPHRTKNVSESLNTTFRGRLIALDSRKVSQIGIEWPPYSPDLNPCDYYLWGYLKDRIYRETPLTINELKQVIFREIRAIENQVLNSVFKNFELRLLHSVETKGSHFENLLH